MALQPLSIEQVTITRTKRRRRLRQCPRQTGKRVRGVSATTGRRYPRAIHSPEGWGGRGMGSWYVKLSSVESMLHHAQARLRTCSAFFCASIDSHACLACLAAERSETPRCLTIGASVYAGQLES